MASTRSMGTGAKRKGVRKAAAATASKGRESALKNAKKRPGVMRGGSDGRAAKVRKKDGGGIGGEGKGVVAVKVEEREEGVIAVGSTRDEAITIDSDVDYDDERLAVVRERLQMTDGAASSTPGLAHPAWSPHSKPHPTTNAEHPNAIPAPSIAPSPQTTPLSNAHLQEKLQAALSTIAQNAQTARTESDLLRHQLRKAHLDIATQTQCAQNLRDELRGVKILHAEELRRAWQESSERECRDGHVLREGREEREKRDREMERLVERLKAEGEEKERLKGVVGGMRADVEAMKASHGEVQRRLEEAQTKQGEEVELQAKIASLEDRMRKEKEEHEQEIKSLRAVPTQEKQAHASTQTTPTKLPTSSPPPPTSTASPTPPLPVVNTPYLSPSPSITFPAPAPPASTSSTTTAVDPVAHFRNLTAIYMTVKKRADMLRQGVRDVVTHTRGMDLSSFGEFGVSIRGLVRILQEVTREEGRAGGVEAFQESG